ncbi:diphthamide biosynthesis protein 4 [[Candida] railenensis]|uniref:Diphthamide biosynthesis protein 4 n=1 Tax=[Candida] railenensis TaxID=45579 RepID=A0A9P0QM40_9ASCO|nr:diphthamide biosynthesis protein 4 [[Candida] railenensis]
MTASISETFYEILSVGPDADTQQIKKAYRKKILQTHPDKTSGSANNNEDTSSSTVSLIKEAYDTLSDPTLREQYDQDLTKAAQTQGYNLSGDGLDTYSLESFEYDDSNEAWLKTCPRCQAPCSIKLIEEDLEQGTDDGEGGLELLVQCGSCSLWIKVKYMEEGDEEEVEGR